MGKRPEQIFHQGRDMDGKQVHGKMFKIISHCVCVCVCVCVYGCQSLSCVWFFATPWTVAHQASLSIGFSRQEYGSGYHALLQGIFQTQGSNPWLLRWQVNSLALSHQGSPWGGSRGGEKYLKDKGDSIYWHVRCELRKKKKPKNWSYQQRHLDFWPEQLEGWSCHKVSWKSYRKLSSGQGAGIISLVWPSYIWRCLLGILGFLGGSVVKNTCQCSRPKFDPWVRKIPWRRKWQPTLVFLPGKSHEQRSLLGYSPWGGKRVKCNWASIHAC